MVKGTIVRLILSRLLPGLYFFAIILIIQWRSGTFVNEFGGHPDEPAHYVTGLMVRDYVANFAPAPPLEYAREYYLHYPKVAIGHWPPLFYVAEAAWMLVFGEARWAIALFLALAGTLLAMVLFQALCRRFTTPLALVLATYFLLLRPVQFSVTHLLSDAFCAALVLWAAACFLRYLESHKSTDALWFGLSAALAILTKGTALALAFLPPLALLFIGEWRSVRRLNFWYPAVIVIVLCGPWYALTAGLTSEGFPYLANYSEFMRFSFLSYAAHIARTFGPMAVVLALGGSIGMLLRARHGRFAGYGAVYGSLIMAVVLYQSVIPAALETRYLLPACGALVLGLGTAIEWLASRVPLSPTRSFTAPLIAVVVLVVYLGSTFQLRERRHYGYDMLAEHLVSDPTMAKDAVLISSRRNGEGMLVSEVAMRDRERPSHYILRATKLMAKAKWSGQDYTLLLDSPTATMDRLRELGVRLIAIDLEPGRDFAHHEILGKTVERYADSWRMVGRFGSIMLYQYNGSEDRPLDPEQLARAVGVNEFRLSFVGGNERPAGNPSPD